MTVGLSEPILAQSNGVDNYTSAVNFLAYGGTGREKLDVSNLESLVGKNWQNKFN